MGLAGDCRRCGCWARVWGWLLCHGEGCRGVGDAAEGMGSLGELPPRSTLCMSSFMLPLLLGRPRGGREGLQCRHKGACSHEAQTREAQVQARLWRFMSQSNL